MALSVPSIDQPIENICTFPISLSVIFFSDTDVKNFATSSYID